MLRRLRIQPKLTLVALVPLVALLVVAVLGWRLVRDVSIGSARYDQTLESEQLVAAVLPPPMFLVEAHLDAHELTGATDPVVVDDLIHRIKEDRATFESEYTLWAERLKDQPTLAQQLTQSHDYGVAFLDAIENQLFPLARAGDNAGMDRVDKEVLNGLFEQHRSSVLLLVDQADQARINGEKSAESAATRQAGIALGLAAALAALAALVAYLVARSISRPVAELTASAREAEASMPHLLSAINSASEVPPVRAVTIESKDELGELANALNSMQSTAVELAASQARVRRNVAQMLANLARRNQSLVNRTLTFISRLEENERDPEALENLFRLDHLTTRMRRNAESLLVLAGSEAPRTWAQPIELGEVVRASLSEIESYDRVELGSIEPAMLRGNAVSDVAHLLAELLDNATRFSNPNTKVSVVGRFGEGAYLMSVVDHGIGMSAAELEAANRELELVGRFEERSTLVLGLAVVARLAARNGIQVRLTESPTEGVTAKVRIPLDLLDEGTGRASHGMGTQGASSSGRGDGAGPSSIGIGSAALPRPSAPAVSMAPPTGVPVMPSLRDIPPAPASGAPAPVPPPPVPVGRGDMPVPPAHSTNGNGNGNGNGRGNGHGADPARRPVPLSTTPNGLERRVPGANMFDTGGRGNAIPEVERSAEDVREALSRFQHGFQSAPRPGGSKEDPQ